MKNVINYYKGILLLAASVPACANGAVRLADGGISGNQGRVEYCRNGRWGTVNGENWSWREGAVVCRQLGHDMTATSMYLNTLSITLSHTSFLYYDQEPLYHQLVLLVKDKVPYS